jgi:exonuclease III
MTGIRKKGLLFGTWNIRTLFKPGGAQSIIKEIEKYKVEIVALQEIRWDDTGTVNIQETTILYGKCNEQRQFGTGFAVHKSLIPNIREFKDINPRISVLTMKAQFFDITFINVHAPSEDKSQEEKDDFYDCVDSTLNALPQYRIRIVLGDLNAKIGKEAIFRPIIGSHSLHETTNDNGLRLIDFACGNGLVVKSTMFPHKDIYKGTWVSPDGRHVNQIDHILVSARFKNCIQDVRTMRRADGDSDHYLVKGKIKIKIKKVTHKKATTVEKYDTDILNNVNTCERFKHQMSEKIKGIDIGINDSIDTKWKKIKDTIKRVTESEVGKFKAAKKPWFNDVCEVALNLRKEARSQWLNDQHNRRKEIMYKERQKNASKVFRNEKRKYTRKLLEEAEVDAKMNRTRQLYQKINSIRGGFRKHIKFLKNDDGSLTTGQEEILEKWRQYFGQLLNCENPEETFEWTIVESNDCECLPPTSNEIKQQINRLKNQKSPGEDGIQGEILKRLDEETISRIHSVIERVWQEERLPEEWNTALVCPIHKKNDPQICNNYRGIALLNVTYKILAYCLLDRVKPIAEGIIGDYQGGFRPNRSTTDQIFVIRQTLQKMWEFNKDVYILFVDFKKAYDSIHRTSLINILREFKFPKKLVKLIEASINGTKIKVKLANMVSQPMEVATGLRQGDALSPILFNLVLEKIVRESNLCEGVELGQSKINILAYADDIALLGKNKEMIIQMGKSLIKIAEKVGLKINEEKTEYMVVSRENRNRVQEEVIEVEEYRFKRVDQFKYLGSVITQNNDIKTEISTRLQSANKCFYGLSKIFRSRAISKNLKVRMYLTLLRPIVLYGAETWSLRKTEELRLAVFERKVLRKIYGAHFDAQTNEWRRLHNDELQSLFQRPNIIKEIKKRRLVWAGHAWRKHESLIKKVIEENPVGRRPLGRPRLRWEDCVKKDTETVEPNSHWRDLAEDRDRWQYVYLEVWS